MEDSDASLRAEIEALKRKVEEQDKLLQHHQATGGAPAAPSRRLLWLIALVLAVLVAIGFATGYIPRQRREAMLVAEAETASQSLPAVTVVTAEHSPASNALVLPGTIQAVTEAPVLARASGYIKHRYVDIGDRVKAGQLLAEIEAPELDQQVRQAQAALEQAQSTLEQANANLQQAKANEQLAKVTAGRWDKLVAKGAVSRQDNDTYQAQYAAQTANVQSLEKAVAAARSNIAAAQANLARLSDLQGFKSVRAPFAGVVTVRNVDVGALVSEASTLLFRLAQTERVRTYVNVPQSDAASVHVGQAARLTIPDSTGVGFSGTVTRTANALDPATRTLLTEIQAANPQGVLLPGMYTQVSLTVPRPNAPLLIPGDTLVVRNAAVQVAVVGADSRVHFVRLQLGRDYGEKTEVLSGLEAGQRVVINPGDAIQEGAKVNAVLLREKKRTS